MTKASLLSLSLALALAACQGDPSPAPVAQVAPKPKVPLQPKRGQSPEELTTGMVEAVTVGKTSLPLAIKFDLPQRPTVGQPLEVVVAVMPQAAASSATVQPSGGDGLQVAANVGAIDIQSLDPSQVYRLNIPVTPTAEGVHLLVLKVSVKQDDSVEVGSFAIPIIVATAGEGAGVAASAVPTSAAPSKH